MDQKFYKDDLSVNDKVMVEIPVHTIIAASAEYNNVGWAAENLAMLLSLCQKEVLDPLFIIEREAAMKLQHDVAQAAQVQAARSVGVIPPAEEQ